VGREKKKNSETLSYWGGGARQRRKGRETYTTSMKAGGKGGEISIDKGRRKREIRFARKKVLGRGTDEPLQKQLSKKERDLKRREVFEEVHFLRGKKKAFSKANSRGETVWGGTSREASELDEEPFTERGRETSLKGGKKLLLLLGKTS